MPCCATFERTADRQFNAKKAARELARYRAKGPPATTRLLLDGIAQSGAMSGTLVDVGAGVGALSFGSLERGITRAVAVDASSAYLAAARSEAERRKRTDAIQLVHGDFVAVALQVPRGHVVVLDRVICCYPAWEPLVDAALGHADQCVALSYPRDVWYVRVGMTIENGQRQVLGNPFRTFIHPVGKIEDRITGAGFKLLRRSQTWIWSVDVYVRQTLTAADSPPAVRA